MMEGFALYYFCALQVSPVNVLVPWIELWWNCDLGFLLVVLSGVNQSLFMFPQEKPMWHCGISANPFLSILSCTWSVFSKNVSLSPAPNSFFPFIFIPRRYHLIPPRNWIITNLTFLCLIFWITIAYSLCSLLLFIPISFSKKKKTQRI